VIIDGTNLIYDSSFDFDIRTYMVDGQAFGSKNKAIRKGETTMCELQFKEGEVVRVEFNKFSKKYEIVADMDIVVLDECQLEDIVLAAEKLLYKDDRSFEELREENEELKRIIEEQEEQFKELTEIAESKGLSI